MFREEREHLKNKGLFRIIISRSSPQGPVITIKGRKYINFSSNDYLGLSGQSGIAEAVRKTLNVHGFGSGASRLLAGGGVLHENLERLIASFKGTESALVLNSGYSANTGIIPAIASADDVILSDELNHASIVDGCRLSKARTLVYRHKDILQIKEMLTKVKARRKIIITDTVFSMDGDIAPLREIYNICLKINSAIPSPAGKRNPQSAILYLDDAHGTGVLGKGRGALAHFQLRPEPWIIQMGTFSKALGSFGAFVAGSRDVIEWLLNTARSFIFSTALPSSVVAASIAALKEVKSNPLLINNLWANRERLISGLRNIGYDTMGSETPIIPVKTGSIKDTLRLSDFLYKNGIFAPAIRPPSVKEPRIRLTVSSAHTEKHIDKLLNILRKNQG